MSKINILWFRNDLRLHDNLALFQASRDQSQVVPVYVIDPRQFGQTSFGLQRTGPFRVRFLLEALEDLRASLRSRGSDLIIRTGKPEEVLPKLAVEQGASGVFFSREFASEELEVEAALAKSLESTPVELIGVCNAALFHPEDLPFAISQTADVFSQFRKKVEKYGRVREVVPTPKALSMPEGIDPGHLPTPKELGAEPVAISDKGVLPFKGGEAAALQRLEAYCGFSGPLDTYKETRNGLLGANYSSKFSPWLAQGSISPRQIYWQVKAYEEEVVANKSTYWLIFELLWRDYFRYWGARHGNQIFQVEGISGNTYRESHFAEEHFQKWAAGETGVPFIDANMRELNATGFMSNRGRQNVASFLVHDLKVNWLKGAEYFESMLLDYDVYSNYGNWAYVAGVGADPRPDRYFNILRQAERYDEHGEFVKHWLPELADVPGRLVHKVFDLTHRERATYGVSDYPPALLIPRAWKKLLHA